LAEAQAHLGQVAEATGDCRKATAVLQAIKDNSLDADQRRSVVLADGSIADAYAIAAADKNTSPREAGEYWRSAREMYQRSLDIMRELRTAGVLDDDEAREIDNTAGKIAQCDAALGSLRSSAIKR